MRVELLCMMCGEEALDACEPGKQPLDQEYTEFWVYCKACDCWTEFPISILDEESDQMTMVEAIAAVEEMADQFPDPRPEFITLARALLQRLGDGWTPTKERLDGIKLTFNEKGTEGAAAAVLYIRRPEALYVD